MTVEYFKRMENGKLLQIWLQKKDEECTKLIPFECSRKYYGEGLKKEELLQIELEEFKTLGWLFNCFDEEEVISL